MNRSLRFLLPSLFLLSGFSSIGLEMVWTRLISAYLGVSVYGVTLTTAGFIAGLALGALLAGSWLQSSSFERFCKTRSRLSGALLIYGLCEGGVGLYALCTFGLLGSIDTVFTGFTFFPQVAGKSFLLLLFLLPPTILMGAGFPLFVAVSEDNDESPGLLYGFNALGGAFGALLPLFFLLPFVGFSGLLFLFAGINLFLSAVALFLSKMFHGDNCSIASTPLKSFRFSSFLSLSGFGVQEKAFILLYFLCGFFSLMLEICWSRLLGLMIGGTVLALGIILASYIAGLAVGSSFNKSGRFHEEDYLFILFFLLGGTVFATLLSIPSLAGLLPYDGGSVFVRFGVSLLLFFPTTFLLGVLFPAMVRLCFSGRKSLEEVTSKVYGYNSLGAVFGVCCTGFLLIPAFGSKEGIIIAGFFFFSAGVWLLAFRSSLSAQLKGVGYFAGVVLFLGGFVCSSADTYFSDVASYLPEKGKGKIVYRYEDALSFVELFKAESGTAYLLNDRRRYDSSSDYDVVRALVSQGILGLSLVKKRERTLLIGLGGGITYSAYGFLGKNAEAVELSEGVIEVAGQAFAPFNNGIVRKANIIRDDGRNYLHRTDKKYDVIISDFFHPDIAGRGNLYTVGNFRVAKEHLSEGGVLVTWFALNQMDIEGIKIAMRTFYEVFPEASLWMDGVHIALVGSHYAVGESYPLPKFLQKGMQSAHIQESSFATWKVVQLADVAELFADAPLNRLYEPALEIQRAFHTITSVSDSMAENIYFILSLAERGESPFFRSAKYDEEQGIAAEIAGKRDQAREYFLKVYQKDPQNYRARMYLSNHTFGEGLSFFNRATRLQQELKIGDGDKLQQLHTLLERAEKAFIEVIRYTPDNLKAINNLAYIRYLRGDRDVAKRLWLDVLGIDPENSDAQGGIKLLEKGDAPPVSRIIPPSSVQSSQGSQSLKDALRRSFPQ